MLGFDDDDVKQVICTLLGVWLTTKPYGASYRTTKEAARTAMRVWDEIEHEVYKGEGDSE